MKSLLITATLALFYVPLFSSAQDSITPIPQDQVMSSRSCGTGCSIKTRQLSYPEVMKDGWIRIQIERSIYFYDHNGNEYTWRGTPSGSKTEGFLFADCEGERLVFGTDADRSNTTEEASIWDPNGSLNNYQPTGFVFTRWERICPTEASEIKRSREI